MDKENLDYLSNIKDRVLAYDDIRAQVVEFLLTNKVKDIDLATDLFIIGFLWEANQRGETLNDDDLIMFLDGGDELEPIDPSEIREYHLEEEQGAMSLEEILAFTLSNYQG